MKIHNVRFGFATNSSSTHSIIILPKDTPLPSSDEDRNFGWQYFTAASPESKRNYALAIVENALNGSLREALGYSNWSSLFMSDWFKADAELFDDLSVDHQSIFGLPRAWNGTGIDRDFAEAFVEFFEKSERLIILGGNDNDSHVHPLSFVGEEWNAPWGSNVVRYDETYNYWTSFCRANGLKSRFTLSEDFDVAPERSSYPELVDLKITDFCGSKCPFCYQDSTTKGLHAEVQDIYEIINELAAKKVFEIAFGGGDTTSHPDFVEILEYAKNQHIVPNFTTKSLKWLKDPKIWVRTINACGAFAYSAGSVSDIQKLDELLIFNGISKSKANIQVVVGVTSQKVLENIIKECSRRNLRLTLLGYKITGRGSEFEQIKVDWLRAVNIVKDQVDRLCPIGIDTVLAATSDLSGIDPRLYTKEEGKFSMYIDAVEMKVGASSFAEEYIDIGMEKEGYRLEKLGKKFSRKTLLRKYGGYREKPQKWDINTWDAYRSF